MTVFFAAVVMAPASAGFERPGDVEAAVELDSIDIEVTAIHRDYVARCANAVGDLQFELYREYDQSAGVWQSVHALRDLIDRAIEARSTATDAHIRTDIVDHARFLLWELDRHVAQLAKSLVDRGPTPEWQLRDEIRLARKARDTVDRLTGGWASR